MSFVSVRVTRTRGRGAIQCMSHDCLFSLTPVLWIKGLASSLRWHVDLGLCVLNASILVIWQSFIFWCLLKCYSRNDFPIPMQSIKPDDPITIRVCHQEPEIITLKRIPIGQNNLCDMRLERIWFIHFILLIKFCCGIGLRSFTICFHPRLPLRFHCAPY
jgi:hypothetical protein